MKAFGFVLIAVAVACFAFWFSTTKETDLERLMQNAASASEDLYKFSKTSEKFLAAQAELKSAVTGRPTGYDSAAARGQTEDARAGFEARTAELADTRSKRETKGAIALGSGVLFLVAGIICVIVGSSGSAGTVRREIQKQETPPAVPPPLPSRSLRIAHNGTDIGDIPIDSVRVMLQTGQLTHSDYFWDPHQNEWLPLHGHQELI